MKVNDYKIILIGIVLIVFFWFAEALLHILMFDPDENVMINLIFPPTHEFWMRVIVVFILVIFSISTQKIFNKLHNMNEKLQKVEKNLRESYDRSCFYKDLFTHDVNNIFSVINSSAELISNYYKNPNSTIKVEEFPEMIQDQIIRGSKLVADVRKLFELEEIKYTIQKIEILDVLNLAIAYVKKSYAEKIIDIQVHTPDEKLLILGNELLGDIFENILINAVKYNENLTVDIVIKISQDTREENEFIKMEFIDNGIGIADKKKKMIFKKNNREYKGSKGMGLGLSLVKKIVESYVGYIWVENKEPMDYSKGSNFIVLLPKAI